MVAGIFVPEFLAGADAYIGRPPGAFNRYSVLEMDSATQLPKGLWSGASATGKLGERCRRVNRTY